MSVVTRPHVKQKIRRRYFWGMDLAQSLNYCGIVIGMVLDGAQTIRYAQIRKFKHVSYPEIWTLCTGELSRRFPPTKIAVDYTSEKAFSEGLEAIYNPTFTNEHSKHYRKWRTILPMVFTQQSKLEMKQISRKLHDDGKIEYPALSSCSPEQRVLFQELEDQMLRESASPGQGGKLSFEKPQGFDNDLAIANELMIFIAHKYLGTIAHDNNILGFSAGREPRDKANTFLERTRERMRLIADDWDERIS